MDFHSDRHLDGRFSHLYMQTSPTRCIDKNFRSKSFTGTLYVDLGCSAANSFLVVLIYVAKMESHDFKIYLTSKLIASFLFSFSRFFYLSTAVAMTVCF